MKKIEKTFTLSDSTVNVYGYRLLTSGFQIDEFKRNPIGYYMHGTGEFPRESGVLLKWDDLQIVGDRVIGKPVINLDHPRGNRTADEVEDGFLNAASVGSIVVLETSDDSSLILPGQTGPTVTKWFNREASLVDIPGNFNAFAELYDKDGNKLNLADFGKRGTSMHGTHSKVHNAPADPKELEKILALAVKENNITPEVAIQLKKQYADCPQGELEEMISRFASERLRYLVSLDWEALDKSTMGEELRRRSLFEYQEKVFETFGKDLNINGHKKEPQGKKPLTIDDVIMYAENRGLLDVGTPEVKADVISGIIRDYRNNPELLLKKYRADASRFNKDILAASWSYLDKNGLLEKLKEDNFDEFKKKFKEEFGVEYKDQAKLYSTK